MPLAPYLLLLAFQTTPGAPAPTPPNDVTQHEGTERPFRNESR